MSDLKFKIGDVVVLKSGGAQMVIQELKPNSYESIDCTCIWHDKDNKPQCIIYDQNSLNKVNATTQSRSIRRVN